MVRGFLSTFGFPRMIPAPAVQGLVYFRRLRISSGWVHFMVDTGSSNTCLHGPVVLPLQSRMQRSTLTPSLGIGGHNMYYKESAIVFLVEENGAPLPFFRDVLIQKIRLRDFGQLANPSLLGRDILRDFDLRVDLKNGTVLLNRLPST